MTKGSRKLRIDEELRKAKGREGNRSNENNSIKLLAHEISSILSNKKLINYLSEGGSLLAFDLEYNSRDHVPKDDMYDFRHRANMSFAWTLGAYGSVCDDDYPEVYHEPEARKLIKELYGSSFFTKPNIVFRVEENFHASCADGQGHETRYVTAEGAKNLDNYTLSTIKELAIGKNSFGERIKLSVPFGGDRWITEDQHNENWLEIKGRINPNTFRDIMRYVTKDEINFDKK